MPIDEIKRIIDLTSPQGTAVLQEVLTDIHNKATGVVYSENAASELDFGRLHIRDDGAGTQSVSIKTGKDNILTLSGAACGGTAGGVLSGTYPNPSFAAGVLGTAALKTAQGSVSTTSYASNNHFTLPGGEYGFFPQSKGNTGTSGRQCVTLAGTVGIDAFSLWTSYLNRVNLRVESDTLSVQQRYVTASGQDHWVFVQYRKSDGRIVNVYEAPDHPAYGNGGDVNAVPHPFTEFIDMDIAVLPLDQANVLKATGDILAALDQDYDIDETSNPDYIPTHTGVFLGNSPVLLDTLPAGVKVKNLRTLSQGQKNAKQQEKKDKADERKNKENATRASLKAKGFTDEELDYMRGH